MQLYSTPDQELMVGEDPHVIGHFFIRTKNAADMERWVAENVTERPLTQVLIDAIIKDSHAKKRRKIP